MAGIKINIVITIGGVNLRTIIFTTSSKTRIVIPPINNRYNIKTAFKKYPKNLPYNKKLISKIVV
jgi:hypothetical protein